MNAKVEAGEPKITRQMTMPQFDRLFPNEEACRAYLRDRRWPNGVHCPRCGNEKVYAGKARPWTWECKKCGAGKSAYRFSVIAGTIFENTNYPLLVWFKVLYLMLTSKKGISALQIHRMIGSGSYRTAWFMCHRLRAGMADPDFRQLMGIVEIDETYFGGKDSNRHWDKKRHIRGTGDKTPVIGAISRKGNVVCQMIEHADMPTMHSFVAKMVSPKVELVATDEHSGYQYLDRWAKLPHQTVNHRQGEYARGVIHTNSMESLWSLLKRGVAGTYHNVSKKYLPLYLNEFQFRFNNRNERDIFGKAVAGC
ncbi:MAG: IS1595 family transposase [Candidatus Binatus sp.]|uniref:IS1595 family transposase n=1 Tax=Candidatus Binatus sp. TaxID=2811406 RepID=UPI002717FEDC|nr:IS1595 family transposase [Candidatus Binatus sp.]MDO8433204.1 IS1595 family transposase [Candidatus Binatus sp.]